MPNRDVPLPRLQMPSGQQRWHQVPSLSRARHVFLLIAFAFTVMADPISSVAYAIEAALRALDGQLALLLPTMALVIVVIAIVTVNYHQLVARFPDGGGSAAATGAAFGEAWAFLPIGALVVDFVPAIAVGSLLDDIPESIVIGLSLIAGGAVSWVAVIAIFLSNIPEGLSSSSGMKRSGRSAAYVFGVWTSIAVITALAAIVGYSVFSHFSDEAIAATTAVAAGAILAMLADTMIPEAFEEARNFAGLITVVGFLAAFMLTKLST